MKSVSQAMEEMAELARGIAQALEDNAVWAADNRALPLTEVSVERMAIAANVGLNYRSIATQCQIDSKLAVRQGFDVEVKIAASGD